MKPGWQTTEFYITLVAQILPFLVLFKVVPADDAQTLQDTIGHAIMAVGAFAAAGASLWKYIQSRTDQKTASSDVAFAEADARATTAELELAKLEQEQ